jgi:hypothetical protein
MSPYCSLLLPSAPFRSLPHPLAGG